MSDVSLVGAVVILKGKKLSADIFDSTLQETINQTLEVLKKHDPSIGHAFADGIGNTITAAELISKDDLRYLDAVLSSFREQMLVSVLVPTDMVEPLIIGLEKAPDDKREAIVQELLTLSPDESESFYAQLKEAFDLLKEGKE